MREGGKEERKEGREGVKISLLGWSCRSGSLTHILLSPSLPPSLPPFTSQLRL